MSEYMKKSFEDKPVKTIIEDIKINGENVTAFFDTVDNIRHGNYVSMYRDNHIKRCNATYKYGMRVNVTRYDVEGVIIDSKKYNDGIVISRKDYTNGKLTKTMEYSTDGILIESIDYNSNCMRTRYEYYNIETKLREVRTYSGGVLSDVTTYVNGIIRKVTKYDCGKIIKKDEYDAEGVLM